MAERLVVKIDLDNQDFKENLSAVEASATKTGQTIAESFSESGESVNKSLSKTLNTLVKAIASLDGSIKSLSEGLLNLKLNENLSSGFVETTEKAKDFTHTTNSLSDSYNQLSNSGQKLVSSLDTISKSTDNSSDSFQNLSKQIQSASQVATNSFQASAKDIGDNTGRLSKAFDVLAGVIKGATIALTGFGLVKIIQKLNADTAGLSKFAMVLLDVSNALLAFKMVAGESLNSTASSIVTFGSIITTVIGFGVIYVFKQSLSLVKEFGQSLIDFGKNAYGSFLQARQGALVFNEIITAFNKNTNNAIGLSSEWMGLIKELSSSLNLKVDSLQKASAEIIQVGTRIGLSREQMQRLLVVVSEYARLMGKDVFDASIAFIQALQGQSNAVLSYGVKLTEASTAQFALKNGLRQSFSELSEAQKIQVRYNYLLSQYSSIAGIAANIANDWFNQQEKLNITLENARAEIGKGAAIVHDFNLIAGLANKILSAMPPTLLQIAGLVTSLGGYFLSFAGSALKVLLVFQLLNHQMKLLNLFLGSKIWATFITDTLPRFGINLTSIARNAGIVNAELTTTKGLFNVLIGILSSKQFSLLEFITGIKGATSAGNLLSIIFSKIKDGISFLVPILSRVLIAMAPLAMKAGIIAGAIYAIGSAFVEVERRTKVFSSIFATIAKIGKDIITIFSESKGLFTTVLSGIAEGFNRVLGLLVFVVGSLIQASLKIVEVFIGVFGKKLPEEIQVSVSKLKTLNEQLLNSGFKLDKVAESIRNVAGEASKVEFTEFEKLNEILKQIADERRSELQKIADTMNERLRIIKSALKAEVISVQEAESAKTGAIQIAQQRAGELIRSLLGRQSELNNQIITDEYNKRQAIINDALNRSLITEEQYRQFTLQNQALFNEQMEQLYQQHAASKLSEAEQIAIAYQISVKQAEAALNAMTQITGAAVNIIAGLMERLGAHLVLGSGAFDDFGKFVLNILGDLAIQVGVLMTGLGTALQKLAAALANPFLGASVIVAGLALIAIGGLLKALASVRPSVKGPVASPPIVADRGGIGPAPIGPQPPISNDIAQNELLPRPDAQREDVGQQITINVAGSIFNTEETGRTLIDLLSKEFNKRGARIVKRAFA